MAYEKTIWKENDLISSEKLNKIEDGLATLDSATTNVTERFECVTNTINEQSADIVELKTQLAKQIDALDELTAKVNELIGQHPEDVVIDSDNATIDKPDVDVVLSNTAPIAHSATVTAKSITAKDLTVESSSLALTADNTVKLTGVTTSGDLPKTKSNAAWKINTSDEVVIDSSTFGQTGYNCIEIGLNNTAPKKITISGIDFTGALTNNAISIFDTANDAIVEIKNCTFDSVSNAIRLSNRSNVKCTLNITDCHVEKWETENPTYAGMLLFQDYTSTTEEQSRTDNRFGPDKITVNITNCTHGSEKTKIVIPAEGSLKDICATGNATTQILYVYSGKEGVVSYSEDRYPTIRIA